MLVYANSFETAPSVSLDDFLSIMARWLKRKEIPRPTAAELGKPNRLQFRSGGYAEILQVFEPELLYSFRYVHPDSAVVGREWFTEIGIAGHAKHPETVSVVVRTEEISSRVVRPAEASRPALVVEFAKQNLFASATPGLDILLLDDEYAAEGLRYSLAIAERKHPYVIVSPTPEGEYLCDPEIIRQHVIGLADVVRIPPGCDTYEVANILGKDFATWRGAINVVLPPRQRPETYVPTVKFLPDMLADIEGSGKRIETEILAAVTHRTNRPMFARHLSPGAVRDRKQRLELAQRKAEAEQRGDMREWIDLLEQENFDLQRKVDGLDKQLLDEQAGRDEDARQFEEQIERLQFQSASAKERLEALSNSRGDGGEASLTDIRDAVLAAIAGEATPEQSLLVLERFFSDRVEILPSAFKSAKESRGFKYPDRAFELLRKLCSEYYDTISESGKGDAQARQIFGESYTARDSELVETNRRARELRTFDYQGVPVEMHQHLKIGVKPSPAETLRIHFAWDGERRKVVIGHCGPHLDHR
jgi:hypothetical protein